MSREPEILYSLLAGLAGLFGLYAAASGDWAGLAVNAVLALTLAGLALLVTFEKRLGKTAHLAAILVLFLGFVAAPVIYEHGDWLKAGRFLGLILLLALFQIGYEWARDRSRRHRKVPENPDG